MQAGSIRLPAGSACNLLLFRSSLWAYSPLSIWARILRENAGRGATRSQWSIAHIPVFGIRIHKLRPRLCLADVVLLATNVQHRNRPGEYVRGSPLAATDLDCIEESGPRVMDQIEPQSSLQQPHTLIFLIATLASLAITLLPGIFLRRARSWERRVYWSGTTLACVCIFLAALPDWKLGIGMATLGGTMMTASAYAYSPYIKFRGRIYAFHTDDIKAGSSTDTPSATTAIDRAYDTEPDAYLGAFGLTSAKKMWWLMVVLSAMCFYTIIIPADDKPFWMTPFFAIFFIVTSAGFGHQDASWGHPVARGQRIQFGIIAIITAGTFTALYLGGYYAAKRWPYRSKRAMQSGMRPHGWKQDS